MLCCGRAVPVVLACVWCFFFLFWALFFLFVFVFVFVSTHPVYRFQKLSLTTLTGGSADQDVIWAGRRHCLASCFRSFNVHCGRHWLHLLAHAAQKQRRAQRFG
jgi:hypothetical protein